MTYDVVRLSDGVVIGECSNLFGAKVAVNVLNQWVLVSYVVALNGKVIS